MILCIVGSTRNGRTALHAREALAGQGEMVFLGELDIKPCTACGACKTGKCPIQDDMQGLYPKLERADGILVASPVYFGTVSAQTKAFFDRTLYLRRKGFALKNKVGGAIAVGRCRNGGQEHTINAIHHWMLIHGMIVVGDGEHFGGTGIDAEEDEFGLGTSRSLGKRMIETIKMLKS